THPEPWRLPPSFPEASRAVFESSNEIPIGDILNAVHSDAVYPEIMHPACHVGVHQRAGGRVVCGSSRNRIIGCTGSRPRVSEHGAAEAVTEGLGAIATSRSESVWVIRDVWRYPLYRSCQNRSIDRPHCGRKPSRHQ